MGAENGEVGNTAIVPSGKDFLISSIRVFLNIRALFTSISVILDAISILLLISGEILGLLFSIQGIIFSLTSAPCRILKLSAIIALVFVDKRVLLIFGMLTLI